MTSWVANTRPTSAMEYFESGDRINCVFFFLPVRHIFLGFLSLTASPNIDREVFCSFDVTDKIYFLTGQLELFEVYCLLFNFLSQHFFVL